MDRRSLAAVVVVAALAVPGLAIAQGTSPADGEGTPTPTPPGEARNADDEAEDSDGHGDVVSALARCLPSGRDLHGTGWTKGRIVSQVARSGEVDLGDGPTEVAGPDDAKAVCAAVEDLVATSASAESDVHARGSERRRGHGPPDHAPAHGRRR